MPASANLYIDITRQFTYLVSKLCYTKLAHRRCANKQQATSNKQQATSNKLCLFNSYLFQQWLRPPKYFLLQ